MGEQSNYGAGSIGLKDWLLRNRTSPRLAFILRVTTMLLTGGLSLLWARLLVRTLGVDLYGLFLTFLTVAQLGGLGDFGISTAVGIRTANFLAKGQEDEARHFLANARGAVIALGALTLAVFTLLSPWLPKWLNFAPVSGAGPLPLLFTVGALGATLVIFNGYFQNLNYIHRNVVWPILPAFLLTQLSLLVQWLLALIHVPLWVQFSGSTLASSVATLGLLIWFLRVSHGWLGEIVPVRFDLLHLRELAMTSGWAYLTSLGSMIYFSTDQILVNAGFGPQQVPSYKFNYKLCELAVVLLTAASYVSIPAIVQRLQSEEAVECSYGLSGIGRLQQLQAFAASAAAVVYLCVNDWFIKIWVGDDFRVPLILQIFFAANLAVTIAGDVGVQVRGRLNLPGLRLAGATIGATGILNLFLSYLAMRCGSLAAIAGATVFAQSVLSWVMNGSTCTFLGLDWRRWILRCWLAPLVAVLCSALLRYSWPPVDVRSVCWLITGNAGILAALGMILGLRWGMIVDEWVRLRAAFR